MLEYVRSAEADGGLAGLLNRFETLYPYLVLIASANHIKDPFDRRVVEAYWLGNTLLRRVKTTAFVNHLTDTLELKKKVPKGKFTPMMDAIVSGVPQHNFHVMNIFFRTGHHAVPQTISTMDNCRISWGRVIGMTHPQYLVETQSLMYQDKRLQLGKREKKVVVSMSVTPKTGDWVSIHWGYVCDILSWRQLTLLKKYTTLALATAVRVI
jgi:hydrogenase maturation factor